jgi:large subunit ribosomal protein L32
MAAHSYKLSKSRKGSRRAHHALRAPGFSLCPRCTQPKLPHRICSNCGFYKGERVVDMRKL